MRIPQIVIMLTIFCLLFVNYSVFAQDHNIDSLKTRIDQINGILDKASRENDYDITDSGKYLVIWEIQSNGSLKIKLETWNNDTINR